MPIPKLQRWIDLLATLLRHRLPVSFEKIRDEIPAYAFQDGDTTAKAAAQRMFERDKKELRDFGIPIETVLDDAKEVLGYRLPPREFYLPYLSVVLDGRQTTPKTVDRDGYRALERLAFEADELKAVVDAAMRVQQLGDPALVEDARSALRKLAADLPVDATIVREHPSEFVAAPPAQPAAEIFDLLSDALGRRKWVEFDYYSMSSVGATRRQAAPLGLFFVSRHWYLAAAERGAAQVKNFRLSRMGNLEVNSQKPGTPDFETPADFRLREHARSRNAWELGDGESGEVIVRFREETGAAVAAARLGAPVEGMPDARAFTVRRLDAFVRWLLPLGDAAEPVSPDAARAEHARQVAATRALYAGDR
ncbi:MAG TPA: WYL domain-containing protein [Gemmatimonadales bacterium]|nr:WYL domain-containing protein [Gemmatimonadales bacterium]